MKLSKKQNELIEKLAGFETMFCDWNGNSETQFDLRTAKSLHKKGLVKLTYIATVGSTITHKLERITK